MGGTAWEALVARAGLRVGESILIHGGAGGRPWRSSATIGAVLTTVREANFRLRARDGRDVLIDYEKEDYIDAVLRATDGRGVDVVFDTIGGDAFRAQS